MGCVETSRRIPILKMNVWRAIAMVQVRAARLRVCRPMVQRVHPEAPVCPGIVRTEFVAIRIVRQLVKPVRPRKRGAGLTGPVATSPPERIPTMNACSGIVEVRGHVVHRLGRAMVRLVRLVGIVRVDFVWMASVATRPVLGRVRRALRRKKAVVRTDNVGISPALRIRTMNAHRRVMVPGHAAAFWRPMAHLAPMEAVVNPGSAWNPCAVIGIARVNACHVSPPTKEAA